MPLSRTHSLLPLVVLVKGSSIKWVLSGLIGCLGWELDPCRPLPA